MATTTVGEILLDNRTVAADAPFGTKGKIAAAVRSAVESLGVTGQPVISWHAADTRIVGARTNRQPDAELSARILATVTATLAAEVA